MHGKNKVIGIDRYDMRIFDLSKNKNSVRNAIMKQGLKL